MSADNRIAACTQLLQSQSTTASNRVAAYSIRGLTYDAKGQYDLAIADYSQALRIDPNDAYAYNYRGSAYRRTGQYDLAIADFSQALRIAPNDAYAYLNRGTIYRLKGQYDLEIADISQSIRIEPNGRAYAYNNRGTALFFLGRFPESGADLARARPDAHAVLWLHIARARSGEDDTIAFATNAASLAASLGTKWPAPIVDLYLGKTTAAQTLASAKGAEQCETVFYIAEWDLLHKHADAARSGFREAVDKCPNTSDAYLGAKAELARLPQ